MSGPPRSVRLLVWSGSGCQKAASYARQWQQRARTAGFGQQPPSELETPGFIWAPFFFLHSQGPKVAYPECLAGFGENLSQGSLSSVYPSLPALWIVGYNSKKPLQQ